MIVKKSCYSDRYKVMLISLESAAAGFESHN